MQSYKVDMLEEWYRKGTVYANSPEEAMKLAEEGSERVIWNEAEYLRDIPESVEVSDELGNTLLIY
jgi:hypothetical protein